MLVSRLRRVFVVAALAAVAVPTATLAQSREVVAKQVSVGSTEASLHLEFADGGELSISFDDGSVYVNDDLVGAFEPGGDLDAAWRELLADAIALDDGPLAAALSDWTVPADLAGELATIARDIDQALEDALDEMDITIDAAEGSVSVSLGDQSSLVEVLLNSVGRLGVLEEALRDLDDDVRVHFDEDVTVERGTTEERTLVVIGGTARIEGRVEGDVVVVGGALDLRDDGRIDGQVRIADARVIRNEGTVRGGIVDVLESEREVEAELRARLRGEVEEQVRDDLRRELRDISRGHDSFSIMAPFRPLLQAVGGIAESLVSILVLAIVGALVLAFGGPHLDVIAETARRTPGRAAMVGLAGTVLLIPVWVIGAVALAVTIIFIPVAIAWLPLFPMAAAFAAVVGYLAVARNAGEWLAESEYPWTGWIRKSNGFVSLVGGLFGLSAAVIAGHVLSIAPFLGFFAGLLFFVGGLISVAAVQIGFGAVILTRAGRRREWAAYDPDEAWAEAMDIDVDDAVADEADDR